ncbi:ornithine decarboxylase [Musca domestica]|uniref:ornithine decarboxylase n=1 Tax=Musca domestica TaxID=7370 RepID=Q27702_MUSDO|nr:ornithine decarboxylase [Musca domestica]AAA98981.1 ornithine decarboxylase [Musca domestica]AAL06466.1 ornithine decarboxylase [Musca domestica]
MFKENEINFYENEIDLKQVIAGQNLQSADEALFVCDLTRLKEKYDMWTKYMPRVKPYYAVKCNDDGHIVKTLAELGTNFDCASKGEIKQVLDLGVHPDRIIFAQPCKPISHLEYAKEMGVMTSTVDTEFEIHKLHKHFPESNLVIRFRCEAKEAQCPLGDKFGCDAENEATSLMLLAKSLNLKVIGTSFHVGSGCNDLPAYDRAITIAKNLFKFGALLGYEMNLLDIGGGFPGSDNKKFEKIAEIVNKSLMRHFPDDKVNIIAEPGRFFVASAYTLICKIHAKGEARLPNGKLLTKMYYLNDGVYGSFNCILYDHQHAEVQHFVDEENAEVPKFNSLIWGPTCDALDKIAEDLQLPDLKCGDFLAFPNMGAYTIPIASPFNGFMLPKILYFHKAKI